MSLYPWDKFSERQSAADQLAPIIIPRLSFTEPTVEPVTNLELADYVKVSAEGEAATLSALLVGARVWCERWTGRAFIERAVTLYLDQFPTERFIEIPLAPISAITSLSTFDDDDDETTFDSASYIKDLVSSPARIILKASASWPTDIRPANGIKVVYTAGYGSSADSVPKGIKDAILMFAAEAYLGKGKQVDSDDFMGSKLAPKDCLLFLEPFKIMR